MVMQYQGSNQSMDDPPQNQENDNIVDPALYLAGDSALLQQQQQQQLRKNWSEASDWRPRGGGIMTMNNQGFDESNMGFEESMETTTCFYFPPSPTNFPLCRPMPSVFFVSSERENISLALSWQHILEDKSGLWHVIKGDERAGIFDLLFDGVASYLNNKLGDLHDIARAAGLVPKEGDSLADNIGDEDSDGREVTIRRINWLEQHDEDNVDQLVYEQVGKAQQLIQNRGGELDVILGGGVFTVNGLELMRDCQGSPTTPETLSICQAKLSSSVWLGHGGQWVAEIRYRCNRLNIGNFTTVEDAISTYEFVARWSRWMDLTGYHGLSENANRLKLPLQLSPAAQEEKPDEDFGTGPIGTVSERTGECVMADQARLNSGCLGKRKTKEKKPGVERRNKKTNRIRITIPLEDISQTMGMRLKDAANHLGASQSTQLNSDTLPSDQTLAATIDTNNAVVKETVPPVFLPTTQQLNLDEDFGNGVEAVGMGSERTEESETEEEFNTVSRSTNGQLNSRNLGKRKREKMTPRGARRNKKTNGVRIAIPLEDILQIEEMPLKDAAKHLKVSISELRSSYREYGIPKWPPRNEHKLIRQSLPNETPSVVDQEGFAQLTSHNGPSDQVLTATIDTNIDKEIPLPQLLPTTQKENPDAGFGNDAVEAIGMGSEKIGEGVMEEGQLNSGCSGKKGKRKVNAAGVKIEITKEDILKVKEMRLNDAAEHLEVSRSTLKRACRENGIKRWPPRKGHELIGQTRPNESRAVEHELINQTRPNESLVVEHELISQTCPNESPAVEHELFSQTRPNKSPTIEHELISQTHLNELLVVEVEQEQTPQLNPDTFLSSNQVSTTIDTKSVKLKARYEGSTITFRLSQPLRKVELEQEVKKRLPLEAGTYNISYKDEDDDLVLIACDDDLEECISSSTPPGSRCHELFLMRK